MAREDSFVGRPQTLAPNSTIALGPGPPRRDSGAMTMDITDDFESVPANFRGVYCARVRGLKNALAEERRWHRTMVKMQEFHPELRPIIAEVERYLRNESLTHPSRKGHLNHERVSDDPLSNPRQFAER
jgi:hypothetical protein